MTDRVTKPTNSMTITEYDELEALVDAFASGKLNLVILVGSAGTSKSQTVRRAVGKDCGWIEGNATAFGMYQQFFDHRDKPMVIDDVDGLLGDKTATRLLKCACQTDKVKSLAWHSATTASNAQLPRQFETRSQVMIIANDWKTLNANVKAVEDRGHLVYFEPTPEALHLKVAEFFTDQDIFNWFADHLHLIPHPSMRHYVRAAELKSAGLDWTKVLLRDTVPEKAMLVAKLKADSTIKTERERVKRFTELGGGNATTWYKWSKRIKAPGDTSHLKVPLKSRDANDGDGEPPTLRVVG